MNNTLELPGTPTHQMLLRRVISHYQYDPRILAVTVFGSLARGNWDEHSDLDLDVVLCDGVSLDVPYEVERLCTTFADSGERPLLISHDGNDAADVVFASLRELSIRYHALATTSPNIIDHIRLLVGSLDIDRIRAVGKANVRPPLAQNNQPFDTFVRLALATERSLLRQKVWLAIHSLDRMRTIVVEVFANEHGGGRPYHRLEVDAPVTLRERLATTLPTATITSIRGAFIALLSMVIDERSDLTANQKLVLVMLQRQPAAGVVETMCASIHPRS